MYISSLVFGKELVIQVDLGGMPFRITTVGPGDPYPTCRLLKGEGRVSGSVVIEEVVVVLLDEVVEIFVVWPFVAAFSGFFLAASFAEVLSFLFGKMQAVFLVFVLVIFFLQIE